MDCTISKKVQFILSETPLYCGVPEGIYYEGISFSLR
jgi:hypothetical protein